MPVDVKICGLTDPAAVDAAVAGGARFVGFVFFPPSPRALTLDKAAALAGRVPATVGRVAVTVDADDALLGTILAAVPIDLIQLHGSEPPARVAAVRANFRRPVIKALPVGDVADLARAEAYAETADWLLFDARPPAGATLPGGNAVSFDWRLLRRLSVRRPWLLAGGLALDNLAAAVAASGAAAVDVSSGVEDRPGVKNIAKIRALLALARSLTPPAFGPSPAPVSSPI